MTILNINENPLIDCYNFESFPYNIISLNPSYSDWIASNYIDLCIHKDCENASVPFKSYLFDYTQIPGMKVEKMDRDFFNNVIDSDILKVFKKAIDRGFYIYLNLDEFYVPNRLAYKNCNYSHDNLIYGYSEENCNFKIFGFTNKRKQQSTEIAFSDLLKGYKNLDQIDNNCFQIYFFKPEECTYNFSLQVVIDALENYLKGVDLAKYNSNIKKPELLVYGIDCYKILKEYYLSTKKMDSRISYKLLEHKKCIKNTISYLITNNYLIDEDLLVQVEELIDLGNIIKNLSLKLILIEDTQLIFKIVQYFEEMEHKEKK